jgi:hypothetical protein
MGRKKPWCAGFHVGLAHYWFFLNIEGVVDVVNSYIDRCFADVYHPAKFRPAKRTQKIESIWSRSELDRSFTVHRQLPRG